MTGSLPEDAEAPAFRWCSPLAGQRFDTTVEVRPDERRGIACLGVRNLRRLQHHDPFAPGWALIGRLLRPLEVVNAGLDGRLTPHRRRAMLDVIALLLVECLETERTFWGWTAQEWEHLLGHDQAEFRRNTPSWAGDEVRPYLAAHAYLLSSFTDFHRLGGFQRLTLARRVFGHDRVSTEIGRVRTVLAEWGYRLGSDDDELLPTVACQLFLLNHSPHVDDLSTELFDRVRRDRLLPGAQMNTLHAMQRAVSVLGPCDPPRQGTNRHSARASGGAPEWERWVDRWHATSTLTPRTRGNVRANLLQSRPLAAGRTSRGGRPGDLDPTDLRSLGRRSGADERR